MPACPAFETLQSGLLSSAEVLWINVEGNNIKAMAAANTQQDMGF